MNEAPMNKGIILAGNMIVDKLKRIDVYPGSCSLTTIRDIQQAVGGLVPNCIQDIARLDSEIPLKAVGLIGNDAEGHLIQEKLSQYPNIDMTGVACVGSTSFTDVMYAPEHLTRAYFQFRGSNADFSIDHIDFDKIEGDILHIGYMLLLDTLDEPHPVYGTKMAE